MTPRSGGTYVPASQGGPAPPLSGRLAACLPLVALGIVLATLAHSGPRPPVPAETDSSHDVSLMTPDPRVSPSKAILLKNQYRYFLRFQHAGPQSSVRQDAVHKYNLFTAECSPDVFEKTHLPRSVR
jgi:hypothetical protein